MFDPTARPEAPSRERIRTLTDRDLLADMMAQATDIVIAIEAQLEFLPSAENLLHARVTALVTWRIAVKDIKTQVESLGRRIK